METKKKKNYFIYILGLLFLCFLVLYISKETGYYEYKAHTKRILTDEAIKEFEKDISEGKDVSVEQYAIVTYTDFSNPISNLGYKTSLAVENFMTKGIKNTFKVFSALFFN